MNQPVIQVQNLRKEYTNFTAVDSINFTVNQGDVFGFLGPNGAGKSTTIRMLTSLISPTSGTISLFGKSLVHHRTEILKRVGAIVERPDLYNFLSAFHNVEIFAKLVGAPTEKKHIMATLEKVGLAERAFSKVKTYSFGMKQRLGIATALVHNPDVVILDEPTTGLDPQGVIEVRKIIVDLSRDHGKTVFLSSHILSEIELVANRMVIINRGKIIVEGHVQELLHSNDMLLEICVENLDAALQIIHGSKWASAVTAAEFNTLHLRVDSDDVSNIVELLVTNSVGIKSVIPTRSLEEFFVKMVSQSESDTAHL